MAAWMLTVQGFIYHVGTTNLKSHRLLLLMMDYLPFNLNFQIIFLYPSEQVTASHTYILTASLKGGLKVSRLIIEKQEHFQSV
jgi:hypothetical protein